MKRKIVNPVLAAALFAAGFIAGYFAERRDVLSRLFPASTETARGRVEAFIRAELARDLSVQWSDSVSIARFCTAELQQLIQIELAREVAFNEGYTMVRPDPMNALKPPFADTAYFVCVTREGQMAARADRPIQRDGFLEIPIAFTSVVGGRTYDQGTQTAIVRLEGGEWRIADMILSDGGSLVRLLRRPKFMQLPTR